MDRLANDVVDLEAVLGREVTSLRLRLAEARGTPERFEILARWIVSRLAVGPETSPTVAASVASLQRAGEAWKELWTMSLDRKKDAR